MLEITLFILIVGLTASFILYFLGLTWVRPEFIFIPLAILVLPGLYVSFTTAPFVPSNRKRQKTMLSLADLNNDDVVYDIGCGDGRFIFAVAPHVKKAVGYDLSVPLVWFGKLKAALKGSKARIRFGDLFKQDYADATLIFCYLLPKAVKRFHDQIWPKLKPGTKVICNGFQMHDLKPKKVEDKVYLYVR